MMIFFATWMLAGIIAFWSGVKAGDEPEFIGPPISDPPLLIELIGYLIIGPMVLLVTMMCFVGSVRLPLVQIKGKDAMPKPREIVEAEIEVEQWLNDQKSLGQPRSARGPLG